MRVEDVQYLLTVASEANLTRAAAKEHVSVPAMSEAIRRIERTLGVTVFDRSNRGMALTPAGRSLQPHLQQLVAASTRLEDHANALCNRVDAVRVGTLFGYGSVALDRIGEIDAQGTGGTTCGRPIEIGIYDWSDPTAGLRAGETELAILLGPTEIDDELISTVIGEEARVAVVSRHHRLATRSSVSLADLDEVGWLNLKIEDGVWRSFWTADEQRGGPPPRSKRSRVNSPQEVAIALRKGEGSITSLREVAQQFSVGHDALVPLEAVPPIPIRLAHRADRAIAGFDALFETLARFFPTPAGSRAILSRNAV